MTKTLILIRHAKSSWGDPLQEDHDRPLNERGREDAPRMGQWLASQGFTPDVILSSDATRTRETWGLIASKWTDAPSPQFLPDLYLAPSARLLKIVRATQADTLVIVAHNPGIGDLANALGTSDHTRFADYPTGAVAIFEGTSLTTFVTPRDLP